MKAPKQVPKRWNHFAHFLPYWQGTGYRALARAKREGFPAIDLDFHVTRDGVMVNLHWPTMALNGFRDPGGRISAARRIEDLTWAEVKRFRGPDGRRVRTAAQMLRRAARLGLRVEFEPKPCPGWLVTDVWQRLAKVVWATQVDLQVKGSSVTGLPFLHLAHSLGFTTIVLPRGDRTVLKAMWPSIDRVRGPVRWV